MASSKVVVDPVAIVQASLDITEACANLQLAIDKGRRLGLHSVMSQANITSITDTVPNIRYAITTYLQIQGAHGAPVEFKRSGQGLN